jgi:23S rRNA (uridine2552-2'-O)-methyltransferase
VTTLEGDICTFDPALLTGPAGGLFHLVLSDMAPNTSGHGDAERSDELSRRILELLPSLLAPTGTLVIKVLEGAPFPALLKDIKGMFAGAKPFKPKASRDISTEIYVIAQGYTPKIAD